ncbi:MAG: hypothetical protein IJV71_07010 [Lachnospiraceae bacterium]|nr:hypothetical protein [Lachnospiraceae bacterium]
MSSVNNCSVCSGKFVPDYIPINSNADLKKTFCILAQGASKKEIILSVNGVAYGIEVDFCPFCGRKLPRYGWEVSNHQLFI